MGAREGISSLLKKGIPAAAVADVAAMKMAEISAKLARRITCFMYFDTPKY
jgi:hypothetical protein